VLPLLRDQTEDLLVRASVFPFQMSLWSHYCNSNDSFCFLVIFSGTGMAATWQKWYSSCCWSCCWK
jgi:hypothetical protein